MKGLTRELIALRIAKELKDGMYINLGIGIPTLVGNFLPPEADIVLHAENGILGYGSIVMEPSEWDIDLVNASGQPIRVSPGACFFDFATSFGMIRGRHLDAVILGAFQVSEKGDLANWQVAESKIGVLGGAMDLAVGAKRVIVAMEHTTPNGKPRIVKKCSLPLTARETVDTIVTSLAYIEVTPGGLVLKEVAPGVTLQEVHEATEPKLVISPELKEMEL